MPVTSSFDFSSAIFAHTNTEIASGKGRLLLADGALSGNQSFAADTGFTYNSALAEFTAGLVRQKDQRPANQTFFATWDQGSVNANWGGGSLVATNNGATLVAGGIEMLGGVSTKYVDFVGTLNADSLQTGCIRAKIKPNYSGSPATGQNFCRISQANGSAINAIGFFHQTSGQIALRIFNNAGVAIASLDLGAWVPVAGTSYEFELNWDITAGANRLFINGVQLGATNLGTGTRSGAVALIRSGETQTVATNYANFTLEMLSFFSTVQHTANYTPGAEPYSFVYAANKVDLPVFTYSGPTDIASITSLTTTEVGSPRYIIAGQYWNGSAWAVSSGAYAQANDKATVNANIAALAIAPATTTIAVSIVYTDASTLSSVDDLTVAYSGGKYAASGAIELSSGLTINEIISFAATITTPALTTLGFCLRVDGTLKYWNGSAWVTSNGTYAQSNSASVINTNASSLSLGSNSTINIYIIMDTTNQFATPEIDLMEIVYTFGGLSTTPSKCAVWGYYLDVAGEPIADATVTFSLIRAKQTQYEQAENNIIGKSVSVLTDANGYFVADLIWSSLYEGGSQDYRVVITKESDGIGTTIISSGVKLDFTVPDAVDKDITDLLTAA